MTIEISDEIGNKLLVLGFIKPEFTLVSDLINGKDQLKQVNEKLIEALERIMQLDLRTDNTAAAANIARNALNQANAPKAS